jgi:hypothetical protein
VTVRLGSWVRQELQYLDENKAGPGGHYTLFAHTPSSRKSKSNG